MSAAPRTIRFTLNGAAAEAMTNTAAPGFNRQPEAHLP